MKLHLKERQKLILGSSICLGVFYFTEKDRTVIMCNIYRFKNINEGIYEV